MHETPTSIVGREWSLTYLMHLLLWLWVLLGLYWLLAVLALELLGLHLLSLFKLVIRVSVVDFCCHGKIR